MINSAKVVDSIYARQMFVIEVTESKDGLISSERRILQRSFEDFGRVLLQLDPHLNQPQNEELAVILNNCLLNATKERDELRQRDYLNAFLEQCLHSQSLQKSQPFIDFFALQVPKSDGISAVQHSSTSFSPSERSQVSEPPHQQHLAQQQQQTCQQQEQQPPHDDQVPQLRRSRSITWANDVRELELKEGLLRDSKYKADAKKLQQEESEEAAVTVSDSVLITPSSSRLLAEANRAKPRKLLFLRVPQHIHIHFPHLRHHLGNGQIHPPPFKVVREYLASLAPKELITDELSTKKLNDFIQHGIRIWKRRSIDGKPFEKLLCLSPDLNYIYWLPSRHKYLKDRSVMLKDVHEISLGRQTETSLKHKGVSPDADRLSFSLIYGNVVIDLRNDRTLDFECKNEQDFNFLVRTLSLLINHARKMQRADPMSSILVREWMLADKDRDYNLSLREVKDLMVRINNPISFEELARIYQAMDSNGDGCLDYDEFARFYDGLRRFPVFDSIFQAYLLTPEEREHGLMFPASLHAFLQREQGEKNITLEKCQEIMNEVAYRRCRAMVSYIGLLAHSNGVAAQTQPTQAKNVDGDVLGISSVEFQDFLFMAKNSAFNPQHRVVYQDMTLPINNYFIASSHNTYLKGHQLIGGSSIFAYLQALKLGARCIELDCWDGKDGEPIIYHGHTLTSQIRFVDVIKIIKEYSFKSSTRVKGANDYPVILSLEVHCSIPQQELMAKIMVETFGDRLAPPTSEWTVGGRRRWLRRLGRLPEAEASVSEEEGEGDDVAILPSPEDLKGMILLQGVVVDREHDESVDVKRGEVANENNAFSREAPASEVAGHPTYEQQQAQQERQQRKAARVSPALSRITHLSAVARVNEIDIACSDHPQPLNMMNFSEITAGRILRERPLDFVNANKKQLTRVYPKGTRFGSSNFDVQPFFNVGCQIVSLNYQKTDKHMRSYAARFAQNGRCGYILKPQALRDPSINYNPLSPLPPPGHKKYILTVTVIGGYHLPKPQKLSKHDIIDPYVELQIKGVPVDEQVRRTRVIQKNGFCAEFNETFEFPLVMKDLALLVLRVHDASAIKKRRFIGGNAFPVDSLMQGYRNVTLKDSRGITLESSFLLCHFRLDEAA